MYEKVHISLIHSSIVFVESLICFKSIYKRTLDTTMSALFEAGLTNKYFNHEMDKVAKLAKEKGSEVIVKPLSLNHLTGLFLLYLIMISACIMVFLFEVFIGK